MNKDDKIFSISERIALQPRRERRAAEAQEVRVLARIEAAEELRRAQAARRLLVASSRHQPRRGLMAAVRALFGGGTSASRERTPVPAADVTEFVTSDAPMLLEFRHEIAKALEEGASPAEKPVRALGTNPGVSAVVVSSGDRGPGGRWGGNGDD